MNPTTDAPSAEPDDDVTFEAAPEAAPLPTLEEVEADLERLAIEANELDVRRSQVRRVRDAVRDQTIVDDMEANAVKAAEYFENLQPPDPNAPGTRLAQFITDTSDFGCRKEIITELVDRILVASGAPSMPSTDDPTAIRHGRLNHVIGHVIVATGAGSGRSLLVYKEDNDSQVSGYTPTQVRMAPYGREYRRATVQDTRDWFTALRARNLTPTEVREQYQGLRVLDYFNDPTPTS